MSRRWRFEAGGLRGCGCPEEFVAGRSCANGELMNGTDPVDGYATKVTGRDRVQYTNRNYRLINLRRL
jgi:hypothetical protein